MSHRLYPSLVLLALALTSACARKEAASAAASIPAPGPCSVALAPAAQVTDRDRAIARAQEDARGTHSLPALERLGYLYVARARAANDPGDYKLAEATAQCLESRTPGDSAALLLRGHALHQLHRFSEAEQIARTLVARRTVVLDYGLLGDALMEQGRLDEAAVAYQKMIDLKPFYQSYTRAAHLRWLKGDLDGAITVIRLAIDTASPRDPESSAWAWTRLAAYELQRGKLAAAADAAAAALEKQPDYAAALLATGRIRLAQHRLAEALEAFRRAARLNPLPEFQWALADALRLEKLNEEADAVERELIARGAEADPRTLSLYLSTRRTQAGQAMALAEAELRTRADIFTLDAQAWALAANGRMAEARDVINRALGAGTQDGRLFLHAGVIHRALGLERDARRWLQAAAGLRPMLLPSEAAALDAHLLPPRAQRSSLPPRGASEGE
ncbi:MAG: tetratricopeptide repeat protein [Vicinamibacterales bacterium]